MLGSHRNRCFRLTPLVALVGLLSAGFAGRAAPPAVDAAAARPLQVCSFNIQFLGFSDRRRNATLAEVVGAYDIVVVQEVVAPPFPGVFPDGTPLKPDPEVGAFFGAMQSLGFKYWLSEEDTGTRPGTHDNGAGTEWFVAFYRPNRVEVALDLPRGFIAAPLGDNPDYERVPYAFAFRGVAQTVDFVLISVHLQPDSGAEESARRKHELASIGTWIAAHDACEKDFIILGDMNIENVSELQEVTPAGFTSLNNQCRPTNTNPNKPRPYDHVMYRPAYTPEVDLAFGFKVVDLPALVRKDWKAADGAFPGAPYDHNRFRAYYSDHDPVVFQLTLPEFDDD